MIRSLNTTHAHTNKLFNAYLIMNTDGRRARDRPRQTWGKIFLKDDPRIEGLIRENALIIYSGENLSLESKLTHTSSENGHKTLMMMMLFGLVCNAFGSYFPAPSLELKDSIMP